MRHRLAGRQHGRIEVDILVDRHRAVAAVARADEAQLAALVVRAERLLFIARAQSFAFRNDPDLQEVHGLALRVIELAVTDARTCGHALHIARPNDRAGADAVLVFEGAVEHVGNDLHVAVAVRAEAHAGLHPVLVDDPQRAEAHMLGVVIIGEREAVEAVEPAVVLMTAGFGRTNGNRHDVLLQDGGRPRRSPV